jgi:hypothetical protein
VEEFHLLFSERKKGGGGKEEKEKSMKVLSIIKGPKPSFS